MNDEPLPDTHTFTPADISVLTERLASQDMNVAQSAVTRLIEMGDPGIEALLDTLTAQEGRRKRKTRNATLTFSLLVVGTLILGFATHNSTIFSMFVAFTGIIGAASKMKSSQTQGAKLLAQRDDVRAVGVLTEALHWSDAEIRASARAALVRLLPRLIESDARYLTVAQRQLLLNELDLKQPSPDLPFAILKAMEQVGGTEALPTVTRVAAGDSRCASVPGMKEAARACLPSLEARASRAKVGMTLLRPSDANSVSPETLLRPAPTTSEEPANELLRPMR